MFKQDEKYDRQSAELHGGSTIKDNKENKENIENLEYSIDGELSDNNKKMLEAFKQTSGFYNTSPKKQRNGKSSQISKQKESVEVPRIYLFGNDDGDYLKKKNESKYEPEANDLETKTLPYMSSANDKIDAMGLTTTNKNTFNSRETIINLEGRYEKFIKEILETLGLLSENDKLQFVDAIQSANLRFIDMKSNGRWDLVRKYFKGSEEDDINYSLAGTNRNILKKKSQIESVGNERKKVKLIEPESSSQLMKSRDKAADDLGRAIDKLTKGFTVKKFNSKSVRVEEVHIYLSYDLTTLACKPKNKNPSIESMIGYNGILDGAKSKNLQRYKSKEINEQLTFSVIFKDRTLDLMMNTLDDKINFIESLKLVNSFI